MTWKMQGGFSKKCQWPLEIYKKIHYIIIKRVQKGVEWIKNKDSKL